MQDTGPRPGGPARTVSCTARARIVHLVTAGQNGGADLVHWTGPDGGRRTDGRRPVRAEADGR